MEERQWMVNWRVLLWLGLALRDPESRGERSKFRSWDVKAKDGGQ